MQAAEQPIYQQIQAERAANLARAQAQMGFSKAAASIMQAAAPAVSNLYSGAANADAGYARGLGDVAQGAVDQSVQGNNAFLSKMGTPAAGLETAAPVGDISYGLHGYIPATTLQREGAAFGSAAQLAPQNVLNQGQQLAGSTLANDKNLTALQGELGKIAGTEPAVYQGLLKQAQDMAYKQASLNSTNAYRKGELGLRQQEISNTASYHQAELQLSAARMAQSALSSNRSYRLSLARLGIEQKRLQMQATKAEVKAQTGGFTPYELNRFKSDAAIIANNAFKGFTDSKGKVHPPLSEKQAMKEMVYGNGHGAIPPSVAVAALKAAGYNIGLSPAAGNGQGFYFNLGSSISAPFGAAAGGVETAAAKTIVGMAHDYLGTPYVWGGESPKGFDCSGFAQYLYNKAGINIPRTTYTQWTAKNGRPVGRNQLEPGDLVFFKGSDSVGGLPGHVGVYIGGGMMIDAPHTGATVEVDNVSSFGGYMGARRYH